MAILDRIVGFVLRRKVSQDVAVKTNSAWSWLTGKKSLICTLIGASAIAANLLGYITSDQLKTILEFVGMGYAAAMADKGNRLINLLKEVKLIGQPVTPPSPAESSSPTPDA